MAVLTGRIQAAPSAGDAPLQPNGSLETDADGDGWPDQWGHGKNGITWEAQDGNHFFRITSSKPGEMVMLYQQIRIPESVRAVEMSWRMRVSDLKKGKQSWFDARIMMDFKDAEGKKLSGAPAPNTGKSTDGWVERTVSFLVPEGARTLDFMPTLFQVESGTFDLDDVVIKPTDPAPLEEKAKAADAAKQEKQSKDAARRRVQADSALSKSGSLITNGDFEMDAKKADQWPDDWAHPKGATWEIENGNHFLRLSSSEPGQTILLQRGLNLPAAKAVELTWRQRVSDLKVGKEPWFDARILMDFKDAAGKKLPGASPAATRNNTQGWVERKVAFLVPEGAVTLELMPALFQVQKGTFDLDDLSLKPVDPESLIAAQKANEAIRKAAQVDSEAPQPAKWPKELHVEGTKVLAKDGKPVWLQGVNVVSLEWSAEGEQVMKAALVATEQWNANIIRLPVAPKWWFGRGPGQKDGGAAYRQRVDDVINLVANRGKYLLLDLHQFGAPRQEHVDFWKDAAAKYKNHPAVLFDLFNEPHGMSWEVWRNGGEVAEKKKPGEEDAFLSAEEKAKIAEARHSIGMQRLLETVRETGARNVVLVGGLDYAYDLSGIANGYALDEKGGNGIILSTHIYPWKKGWADKVLIVADKFPILVGEVGAGAKKMEWLPVDVQEDAVTWVPEMLGFIQKYKLHWTAFSFHPKAGPPMLEDWSYKPNAAWGVFVKRALDGEKFELKKLR
ncbi:glycoside hydrolase family 5 protein [Verrucomicrobiota bacterium sgz303538]